MRLRAYDAVQLAAVLEIRQEHRDAGFAPVTLISADQALNDAAAAEGLAVDDPRSHPLAARVNQFMTQRWWNAVQYEIGDRTAPGVERNDAEGSHRARR